MQILKLSVFIDIHINMKKQIWFTCTKCAQILPVQDGNRWTRFHYQNQYNLPENCIIVIHLMLYTISTSTIHQVLYIKNRFQRTGDWSGSQGACCINFTNLWMSIYKDTVDQFLIKRMELISINNREKQPSPIL